MPPPGPAAGRRELDRAARNPPRAARAKAAFQPPVSEIKADRLAEHLRPKTEADHATPLDTSSPMRIAVRNTAPPAPALSSPTERASALPISRVERHGGTSTGADRPERPAVA